MLDHNFAAGSLVVGPVDDQGDHKGGVYVIIRQGGPATDGYQALTATDAAGLRDWLDATLGPIKPPVQECVCGRPDDADEPVDESANEAAWQKGYIAALQAAAIKADEDEDDAELSTVQNLRVWAIDQSTALEAETKVEEAATLVAFVLKGEVA